MLMRTSEVSDQVRQSINRLLAYCMSALNVPEQIAPRQQTFLPSFYLSICGTAVQQPSAHW